MGYELDDWQEWCIDGMLSEDAGARLCAAMVLMIVSRQNGKNVILEVVELYAFYVLGLSLILHTAHLQETSATHMARLQAVVQADPELDAITVFSTANGKERMYRSDTGAIIRFVTRGKKTGRGGSPQMLIWDEALYLNDDQLQAILSSLSAQSMRRDPPIQIFTSSAPLAESTVLHRVRANFVTGAADGFFAEWSVDDTGDIDITDRNLWFDNNPGMGVRISDDWVAENELTLLTREAFMAERLGVAIGGSDSVGSAVLPVDKWAACGDDASEIADGQPSNPALAVGPGMVWASFADAGRRADGDLHVEVIRREPGTSWVVAEALRVVGKTGRPLIVDPKSPTAALFAQLKAAGVELLEVSTAEYVQGCAALQNDVINAGVHHIDQPPLNAAVVGADIRPVGEAWAWSQKSSAIDITSLVAVTLAASVARQGGDDSDLWFSVT